MATVVSINSSQHGHESSPYDGHHTPIAGHHLSSPHHSLNQSRLSQHSIASSSSFNYGATDSNDSNYNRLQNELGISCTWSGDGCAYLEYPAGDRVKLEVFQGLAFIDWEHFMPIRKLLAVSHAAGRPKYVHRVVAAIVEEYQDPVIKEVESDEIIEAHCNV